MTRLHSSQVLEIPGKIEEYEKDLIEKIGMSLAEVGWRAKICDWTGRVAGENVRAGAGDLDLACKNIAVVPVTAGQGQISGFCQAVKAIIQQLGFNSVLVTENNDVSGISEAMNRKAEIIFMADDDDFIAFNTNTGRIINNDKATARAYAVGLAGMAENYQQKDVLVLGGGKIGCEIIKFLLNYNANPVCYDPQKSKTSHITKKFGIQCYSSRDIKQLVKDFHLIFDATPAADIITAEMVDENTYLAAPGIPAGFTRRAAQKLESRLLHDPLQLGVAVMAFAVI